VIRPKKDPENSRRLLASSTKRAGKNPTRPLVKDSKGLTESVGCASGTAVWWHSPYMGGGVQKKGQKTTKGSGHKAIYPRKNSGEKKCRRVPGKKKKSSSPSLNYPRGLSKKNRNEKSTRSYPSSGDGIATRTRHLRKGEGEPQGKNDFFYFFY